jgi:putative exporter of polyketide antibiotics
MEEKNISATKPAMTYGLILGLALVIMHIVQYVMDVYKPPFWVSLINYAVIVAVIVYGTIRYRDDDLDGYISYGKALGFGVLISLFASIIYGFYFIILTSVIDPSYMEGVYTMIEETYIEMGMDYDQIETAMGMVKKFTNPVFMGLSSVFNFVLMGTVFSLITSIFLKKEKPLFEEAQTEE